jgi:hypothetical protein
MIITFRQFATVDEVTADRLFEFVSEMTEHLDGKAEGLFVRVERSWWLLCYVCKHKNNRLKIILVC